MSFEITGFDKLEKELKRMSKAVTDLEKTKFVDFDELFTKKFMRKHTNFSTFNELLTDGSFIVNSQEDFEAIPDDKFDKHILKTTKFNSWEEMLSAAGEEYTVKKLGF